MSGVEILSTKEVATAFTFNWTTFWVMLGIAAVIFLIIGIIAGITDNDVSVFGLVWSFGLIVSALIGLLGGSLDQTPTEYETQYKVTISDEVSMNDFLEIYEIVDQDGKIYTVRERGNT